MSIEELRRAIDAEGQAWKAYRLASSKTIEALWLGSDAAAAFQAEAEAKAAGRKASARVR